MNTIHHPDAGVCLSDDGQSRYHAHLRPQAINCLRRFKTLIQSSARAPRDAVGAAAASMVALDGIAPSSLSSISATGVIYRHRGATELQWCEGRSGQLERRILCNSSDHAIQALGAIGLAKLEQTLHHFLASIPEYKNQSRRLALAEEDARAWWRLHLPPAIFFHLAKAQVMTALPRDCRARKNRCAVPHDPSAEPNRFHELAEASPMLLDSVETSFGSDAQPIEVERALSLLRDDKGQTPDSLRKRWLVSLLTRAKAAKAEGPISSLLLAWLADMLESGTIQKDSPRPQTIRDYFQSAALDLWRELKSLPADPSEWESEDLEEIYLDLLQPARQPGSSGPPISRKLAPALSNFHSFLVESVGVPNLHRRLAGGAQASVRAHVIWPHEVKSASEWALRHEPDRAMGIQLALLITLGASSGLRIGEMLALRVSDLHWGPDSMEVEVTACRRGRPLKSAASQRRVSICAGPVIDLAQRWLSHRTNRQDASPTDLLFGDALEPRRVPGAHRLRHQLNLLLKAFTGNPAATAHDLRHTAGDFWISPILATSPTGESYPLQQVATTMGHVHAGTTLRNYVHSYEEALRHHLNAALHTSTTWTGPVAAKLMGLSDAALRQRSHRLDTPMSTLAWQHILKPCDKDCWEPIEAPWVWAEASGPNLGRPRPTPQCTLETLNILVALAKCQSGRAVAQDFRCDESWVSRLEDTAKRVAHEVAMFAWPLRVGSRAKPATTLNGCLLRLGFSLTKGGLSHSKYGALHRWLVSNGDREMLRDAWNSWLSCLQGNLLSLQEPDKAKGLFRLLKDAGVEARMLRICHREVSTDLIQELNNAFATVFGRLPRLLAHKPRLWVPSAYLQWDGRAGDSRSAAPDTGFQRGGSIAGLHALMFTVGVQLEMENEHGLPTAL
jgi:integrase